MGSLHDVAERAKDVGSPNVLVVAGDVANPEDCQRFVQATVDHFGRLDHLVNNAGVANVCWFEEVSSYVADLKQVLVRLSSFQRCSILLSLSMKVLDV